MDEDSENEKLSPLLQKIDRLNSKVNNLALNMEDVVDPIDDQYTDQEEQQDIPEKNKNYGKFVT